MTTYRKYNWPELFEAFEQSGLTQTEFSQQNSINPKYFNLKLNKHRRATSDSSGFTRLHVTPPIHSASVPAQIVIELSHCRIHCPTSMQASDVAVLVRSLA